MNVAHPMCNETDTMVYKLKYVRLRAIHEEEWQSFRARMTATDLETRQIILRKNLTRVGRK